MPISLSGSLLITGSLTTSGTLTAQTLVVQTVTSSIVYSSGSNIFGNSQSNVQQMTGSLRVTGSAITSGQIKTSFAGQSISVDGGSIASVRMQLQNTSGNAGVIVESSTGGDQFSGTSAYSMAIGTYTEKNFHIGTNSVTRLTVSSSGQVGIGTTSYHQPYTKLIVAGAIAYNNNSDAVVSDNSYGQSFAKKIDIVGDSGANTIYSAAGSEGAFYVISGLNQTTGARFVDLVLYLGAASTTPVVVSSQTFGSPGGRTYGNSGENLTLSITGNSNTYTVRMTGMGANEKT